MGMMGLANGETPGHYDGSRKSFSDDPQINRLTQINSGGLSRRFEVQPIFGPVGFLILY
jgi:hypothetical protein